MITDVMLTARSANSKTGPIPVTYRPVTTCPTECAFHPTQGGGCYGTGRIFGIARKHAGVATHDTLVEKLQGRDKSARFLRDRVVGDVLTPEGTIDHGYLAMIARAAAEVGLRAFGYTHAWRRFTADDVTRVKQEGYVMNASCETREDVEQAVALGFPVVITGDEWEDGTMIAGKRVVTCPAQTHEKVTCASCGLCARPQRSALVRFLVHGIARNKAQRSIHDRKGE